MFQKYNGYCISPPHLLLHRLSRRQQGIHTTPRPSPSELEVLRALPLLSLGQHGPRMERKNRVQRAGVRTRVSASTTFLFFHVDAEDRATGFYSSILASRWFM
jgi:hypothetical protein